MQPTLWPQDSDQHAALYKRAEDGAGGGGGKGPNQTSASWPTTRGGHVLEPRSQLAKGGRGDHAHEPRNQLAKGGRVGHVLEPSPQSPVPSPQS